MVEDVNTAEDERRPGSGRVTILVVEDDNALREFLCTALADEFDVTGAVSGEEAVDLARRLQPDVILLDVMLPGLSGLDVIRVIRSDPGLRDTPVLVMTAFSEIEPGEAEAAGANRFLAKPFDLQELTAAVKDLL
jgi:CheY-like chemotaxis protein